MICPICFCVNDESHEKSCEGHGEIVIRYCRNCGEHLEHCVRCLTEDNIEAYIDGYL